MMLLFFGGRSVQVTTGAPSCLKPFSCICHFCNIFISKTSSHSKLEGGDGPGWGRSSQVTTGAPPILSAHLPHLPSSTASYHYFCTTGIIYADILLSVILGLCKVQRRRNFDALSKLHCQSCFLHKVFKEELLTYCSARCS